MDAVAGQIDRGTWPAEVEMPVAFDTDAEVDWIDLRHKMDGHKIEAVLFAKHNTP